MTTTTTTTTTQVAQTRQDGTSSQFRAAFSAEETLVQVIPDFTAVPDFMAGVPTWVPLWKAELLQMRSLGRIVPPEWLDVTVLRSVLQQEKTQPLLTTTPLPFYYYEITRKLTNRSNRQLSTTGTTTSSSDDDYQQQQQQQHPDIWRLLVEDIFQIRVEKLRQQFPTYLSLIEDQEIPKVDVPGIASAELTLLKSFLLQALSDRAMLLNQKETLTDTNNNNNDEYQYEKEDNNTRLHNNNDDDAKQSIRSRIPLRRFR